MAYINRVRFAGLFSYSEESEIEFSDRMVIVGPNNSGKSNIIRILNLFVETFSKGRLLQDGEISSGGVNPFLEITLELSKKETEKIIQLLSFYPVPPNNNSQYLGSTKELDVEGNDVIITSVDGKDNFLKYRDLLDTFEIPYVILADSDAKNLFDSSGTVTKEGITGSRDIAVIENKNLEQLMRDIDSKTYSQIEKEIGNSKPTVAYLFAKEVLSKDPNSLKPLTPLLLQAIEKSHM